MLLRGALLVSSKSRDTHEAVGMWRNVSRNGRLTSGQEWKAIPILTRIEYREEDGHAFLRDPTSPDLSAYPLHGGVVSKSRRRAQIGSREWGRSRRRCPNFGSSSKSLSFAISVHRQHTPRALGLHGVATTSMDLQLVSELRSSSWRRGSLRCQRPGRQVAGRLSIPCHEQLTAPQSLPAQQPPLPDLISVQCHLLPAIVSIPSTRR